MSRRSGPGGNPNEIDRLRNELADAREALRAIRSGEVDALVVSTRSGDQLFTLTGADQPYRLFVDAMAEGALVLAANGTVLSGNRRVADIAKVPLNILVGASVRELFRGDSLCQLRMLLETEEPTPWPVELAMCADGREVPVSVTASRLDLDGQVVACLLVTDVSDRKKADEAQRFQARLLDAAGEAIIVTDGQGRTRYVNAAAEHLYGWGPGEMLGRLVTEAMLTFQACDRRSALGADFFELVHPDDRGNLSSWFLEALHRPGEHTSHDCRVRRGDATFRTIEMVSHNLLEDPSVRAMVINGRDVTERRHAEGLLRTEARILDDIAAGAPLEHIAKELATAMESHVADTPCLVVLSGEEAPVLAVGARLPADVSRDISLLALGAGACPWLAPVAGDSPGIGDLRGEPAWPPAEMLDARYGLRNFWGVPVRGPSQAAPVGAVLFLSATPQRPTAHDIDVACLGARLASAGFERQRALARIAHDALYDPLTGLPNRALLLDRTAHALARSRRTGTPIALLMVDLDHFKLINDSLGHSVGDEVLAEVGRRFVSAVRSVDTVARFGGDEFLILLDGCSNEGAMRTAQRVLTSLQPPMSVGGHELYVGASIGISANGKEADPEFLIRDADAAMYRAKESGRGRVEMFNKEMRLVALERVDREDRLRRAIDQGLIQPHYQPIIQLATSEVVGAEALARWTDAEIGVVAPTVFVPLAEDTGLIGPLGTQILTAACKTATGWASTLTVCVNLSARQMGDAELAGTVEAVLRDTGLDPRRLLLEITESVLMERLADSTQALNRLLDLGVRLSIDDFGTGYSSLARLKRLPVAQLKIDRAFISGLPDDADDLAIVTAVITMGHSLGLTVVAEGIETEEQLAVLRSRGCDLGQGFLFSPALPAAELPRWLDERGLRKPIPTLSGHRPASTSHAPEDGRARLAPFESAVAGPAA